MKRSSYVSRLFQVRNENLKKFNSEASTESVPQCEEVKEISNFLSQPLLERQQCPLEWRAKNSEDFPNLSQLAKKYLSAPGSTIYSERLFSEAERDLLNILLCLHQTSVMDSIGKDCIELKRQYEACFNAWYSESFLKNKNADMSICNSLFQEYQKCLKVAIKKNNIPLWELDKEILQAGTKTNESGPS